MKKIKLLFILFSYLFSFSNGFSLKNIITKSNPYNYYVLAVQKWCSSEYKIHGLWPQYNEHKWPSFCKDLKYKKPQKNLLKEMEMYWNTCGNDDLWKHEWEKHGSCVEIFLALKENEYFEKTLKLYKDNLKKIHNNCNGEKNCYNNCFDLEFNNIDCPSN